LVCFIPQQLFKGGRMKPTFVKKNTAGGAAGLSWEAGEVKVLHSLLADELVALVPEDYEIVQEDEYTPEDETGDTSESTDSGTGETAEEEAVEETEDAATETIEEEKPKKPRAKKQVADTETPSAE
jgi:hypothetical protein